MSLLIIDRNAEKLDVLFFEFVVRITERARFLRSARCVVFWVKEQDHALTFIIRKFYRIAVVVFRFKVWGLVAFFEHKPPRSVGLNCFEIVAETSIHTKTTALLNFLLTKEGWQPLRLTGWFSLRLDPGAAVYFGAVTERTTPPTKRRHPSFVRRGVKRAAS